MADRQYERDEGGKFASSGSGGSAKGRLSSESRRRIDEAVAHRERVAQAQTPVRASDARGVDQPESRLTAGFRITSRQTRREPERPDRRTGGAGRSFFG